MIHAMMTMNHDICESLSLSVPQTQFLIFLFQGVMDKIYDNPMPKVFTYFVYTYVLTLLILFFNFYVKSYKRAPSQKPIKKYNGTTHGTAHNGEVVSNGNSHKID